MGLAEILALIETTFSTLFPVAEKIIVDIAGSGQDATPHAAAVNHLAIAHSEVKAAVAALPKAA